MNEPGEPNMGNPSVRFDEGPERVGHWPCAFQPSLSCLLYFAELGAISDSEVQKRVFPGLPDWGNAGKFSRCHDGDF